MNLPGFCTSCVSSWLALAYLQEFSGTVGFPLPLLTFCLESVPEMQYDACARPPRGEVLIRGPVVFQARKAFPKAEGMA